MAERNPDYEISLARMTHAFLPASFLTAEAVEKAEQQKKKLKTETVLTSSSSGGYYSVSLTRLPNAPPPTIPRTFQTTTRTPTITID
jgi:hypothetical protein